MGASATSKAVAAVYGLAGLDGQFVSSDAGFEYGMVACGQRRGRGDC